MSWLKIFGSLRKTRSGEVRQRKFFKLKIFLLTPSMFQVKDFRMICLLLSSLGFVGFSSSLKAGDFVVASTARVDLSAHKSLKYC